MKKIPDTYYYYFSYILMPGLGLLQTKVLSTILPISMFGQIQLILPLIGWAMLIGGVGAPQFLVRIYSREGVKVYHEGLFITIIGFFIIGLFAYTFIMFFGSNYKGIEINAQMVLIVLLAALIQQIIELIKSLLRACERHILYNLTAVCTKIFIIAGAILGVIIWSGDSIKGYMLGTAIASVVVLLILNSFLQLKNIWKPNITSWLKIKQLLSYSIPIVSIMLMGNMLPNLNRFVIFAKLGTGDVAKYALGCIIASLCFQTLYEPLNIILHPRVFRLWETKKKREVREIIIRYLNLYIIIGIILFGLATRFERFLVNIVANSNYYLPTGSFGILLFSNFILGIYRFMSIHYYLEQNTFELGFCFFLSIIVNFATALMLIGKIGLLGAALSVLSSAIVLTAIVWIRSQKNLRVRVFFKYILLPSVISFFFIIMPRFFIGDIFSLLQLLDVVVSFAIATCCVYFIKKVLDKNYKLLIAK